MVIEAHGLVKRYRSGGRTIEVIRGIDLTIEAGSFVAVVGPSGSGKTTLLGLLAGLDEPTAGSVALAGNRLSDLTEDERAEFRATEVGFVFQTFHLLPTLTALENVAVPLELSGARARIATARAADLLGRVGLDARLDHYPSQLSGGEQQRVALARAFVNQPRILFADEPTGNLDRATGETVVHLMDRLNRQEGATLVLVTHDRELASRADRVLRIEDGRIVREERAA